MKSRVAIICEKRRNVGKESPILGDGGLDQISEETGNLLWDRDVLRILREVERRVLRRNAGELPDVVIASRTSGIAITP